MKVKKRSSPKRPKHSFCLIPKETLVTALSEPYRFPASWTLITSSNSWMCCNLKNMVCTTLKYEIRFTFLLPLSHHCLQFLHISLSTSWWKMRHTIVKWILPKLFLVGNFDVSLFEDINNCVENNALDAHKNDWANNLIPSEHLRKLWG